MLIFRNFTKYPEKSKITKVSNKYNPKSSQELKKLSEICAHEVKLQQLLFDGIPAYSSPTVGPYDHMEYKDFVLPEYDFHSLLGPCEEATWLSAMHNVIKKNNLEKKIAVLENPCSTQEYLQWSKSDTIKLISSDKKVGECGHSGGTFSWTLFNLHYIYNEGWTKYTAGVLKSKGYSLEANNTYNKY